MRAVAVIFVIIGFVASEETCPALDNDNEGWSDGKELLDSQCKDISDGCSACSDKCTDTGYSHWMEKNCAETCGFCSNRVVPSSGTICWNYCYGYADEDILETVDYTTFKDCSDRCLENDECGGVHTTDYSEEPKYCILAKSDASLSYIAYVFGATRTCLEDNPGDDCDDAWSYCATYSGYCTSTCPYMVKLMESVCLNTCGFCTDDDEAEEEEDEGEDEGEEESVEWNIIEGKKVKGTALESGMTLDEAKTYCQEAGDTCAGLSCKGTNKCSAMPSISKKKANTKYDTYKKVSSRTL